MHYLITASVLSVEKQSFVTCVPLQNSFFILYERPHNAAWITWAAPDKRGGSLSKLANIVFID